MEGVFNVREGAAVGSDAQRCSVDCLLIAVSPIIEEHRKRVQKVKLYISEKKAWRGSTKRTVHGSFAGRSR